ncbi:MAG: NADP-dependent succinic semialdehyde dehydrogenase [Candidatus Meridianibacter frigidus]|nr:MAG: NADP-dependent succinic semialdehyde dehydrogenase [Candidatus Eremiobacteraeota bacterium]
MSRARAPVTTIDPYTGGVLERFAYTSSAQLEATLNAAVGAQRRWSTMAVEKRADVLRSVGARLRSNGADLALTAAREMGKPLKQARAEIEKCAWCCDFYAEHAREFLKEEHVATNATRSYVAFRPLGIVLAIMPWNFPYWQVFRAAAPALMAGNGILLKHASNVTRCALEIERLFNDAGAPTGIFSVIIADNDATSHLLDDSRIAAATLTGSVAAGRAVAAKAGRALKKVVLELGGSDAFVVLADADLDAAAQAAVRSRFQNAGQSCIAAKRFIVESSVYDAFLARFAEETSKLRAGDPKLEETDVGPMAREDLRDALKEQVAKTLNAGAQCVTGGRQVDGPGFFYQPTIVAGVTPQMPMFKEETFGPAAAVARAADAENAIALANTSSFGLGGTMWTTDVERGAQLAARMECGSVFLNGMMASDPRLPFGGVKNSGYGRELSHFGIREFVNVQSIWIGPATV